MFSDATARLRKTGEKLPPRLRDEMLALGPSAIPELIALVEDDEASEEESPGGGWPPIHAVDLLADLRATEAVEPMLRALVRTDWMAILHDRVLLRLPELGSVAVEPALALLEGEDEQDVRESLCAVLSKARVRDDRIYRALCRAFEESEMFAAPMLADYGDPAALPLILGAIDRFDRAPDPVAAIDLGTLVESVEGLGGVLPANLQERVDLWFREWQERRERLLAQPPRPTARRKVGRNEPCPCGSGKKYKKCCIDAQNRSPAAPAIITRDGEGGPAQQMADYAQPLLENTDGSAKEVQSMLTLGMHFWNAALMPPDEREAALAALGAMYEPGVREEFWETARWSSGTGRCSPRCTGGRCDPHRRAATIRLRFGSLLRDSHSAIHS